MDSVSENVWFLVAHGNFYRQELVSGRLFVPPTDLAAWKIAQTLCPGNVLLSVSPAGLSAIGRVTSPPYPAPFPAWRAMEGNIGDRGLTIAFEYLLLPTPVPLLKAPTAYLTGLTRAEISEYRTLIEQANPRLCQSEWVNAIFDAGRL